MNTPLKTYSVPFTSDGVSLTLTIDASLLPIGDDFKGNQPVGVINPLVTFTQVLPIVPPPPVSPVAGISASLEGTKVIFTFPGVLPQFDQNNALVVYTAQFTLQFPI